MTSTNEILPLNIILKYTYIDDDNKEQPEDLNIIKDGNFNMNNIRNINFYDNYINTFDDKTKKDKDKLKKQLSDRLEDNNDKNINFKINLPFSKNYITKENMDLVVTEERNESEITSTFIKNILGFYEKYKVTLNDLINESTISDIKINNLNKENFLNIIKDDRKEEEKKKLIEDIISKINFNDVTYKSLFTIFDSLSDQSPAFYAQSEATL